MSNAFFIPIPGHGIEVIEDQSTVYQGFEELNSVAAVEGEQFQ